MATRIDHTTWYPAGLDSAVYMDGTTRPAIQTRSFNNTTIGSNMDGGYGPRIVKSRNAPTLTGETNDSRQAPTLWLGNQLGLCLRHPRSKGSPSPVTTSVVS
jgi:hypothetical protein